jgi:Rrf2 family protein
MRISTKSQYGLRAMVYLAKVFKKDKVFPLREIAKKEGISFDYLEKIISKLEKSSLVKAKKGVQGGYFLAKKPSKIKIGKIIKALEGEIVMVKCLKYFCPKEKKCLTKNFWQKLNKAINEVLNSMTLADLMK